MKSAFRPCVLGVFTNQAGQVFVAERAEPRGAWQFPQGGIEPEETPEQAVRREMREELGVAEIEVVGRVAEPIRYAYPPELESSLARAFKGQEQFWFQLRFKPGMGPDLALASDQEFVAFEWVGADEAMRRIVHFKREAYRLGLMRLGLLGKE